MILPTNRQIQIIADSLNEPTAPPHIDPAQLSSPWREFYTWVQQWIAEDPADVDPRRLQYDFYDAHTTYGPNSVEGFAGHYELIKQAMQNPITYPSAAQTLAGVKPVEWLWKGWLLRGLPSLLAAVPGTGKSYLALDLAYRIIAGLPFPDGSPSVQPCERGAAPFAKPDRPGPAVLYVDAENTPAIHKERLSVWPPHIVNRLYLMLPEPDRLVLNLDDFPDRDRLRDMAWQTRPSLIIVDSYGSCTLKGENNKEDVQVLLAFFNQLAREFDCAVLVIHHLRKGANTGLPGFLPMTIDAIRGSSHIAAMARHIWALQFVPAGPEPSASDPRRLWVMKTNVGRPPEPLGVDFTPHPDNPDVAQITYGDAPQPFKEPTKVEECADWILTQLRDAGEPIKPSALVECAKHDGYYSSLIYRARKLLGDLIIDTQDKRRHPHNAWALAEWMKIDDKEKLH